MSGTLFPSGDTCGTNERARRTQAAGACSLGRSRVLIHPECVHDRNNVTIGARGAGGIHDGMAGVPTTCCPGQARAVTFGREKSPKPALAGA